MIRMNGVIFDGWVLPAIIAHTKSSGPVNTALKQVYIAQAKSS